MTTRNILVNPKTGTLTFDWSIRGTHKGAFQGKAPTNKLVTIRGNSELTVKKGKIKCEQSRQDIATFMKQLSATAAGTPK